MPIRSTLITVTVLVLVFSVLAIISAKQKELFVIPPENLTYHDINKNTVVSGLDGNWKQLCTPAWTPMIVSQANGTWLVIDCLDKKRNVKNFEYKLTNCDANTNVLNFDTNTGQLLCENKEKWAADQKAAADAQKAAADAAAKAAESQRLQQLEDSRIKALFPGPWKDKCSGLSLNGTKLTGTCDGINRQFSYDTNKCKKGEIDFSANYETRRAGFKCLNNKK